MAGCLGVSGVSEGSLRLKVYDCVTISCVQCITCRFIYFQKLRHHYTIHHVQLLSRLRYPRCRVRAQSSECHWSNNNPLIWAGSKNHAESRARRGKTWTNCQNWSLAPAASWDMWVSSELRPRHGQVKTINNTSSPVITTDQSRQVDSALETVEEALRSLKGGV